MFYLYFNVVNFIILGDDSLVCGFDLRGCWDWLADLVRLFFFEACHVVLTLVCLGLERLGVAVGVGDCWLTS